MLLYLVFDKNKKTVSTPLLAPSLEIAQTSLNQLNPENLNDLIIHPIKVLSSPLDLFLLNIDETLSLPDFIIPRDNSLELSEDTTEGREASL